VTGIGLLRHADGVVPLHEDGYSVGDVTLGLLVVCREPSPSPAAIRTSLPKRRCPEESSATI
jgi:hypothetical protein